MKYNKVFLRNSLIVMIVLFNVGCDQISKTIVRKEVAYNASISLIDNYLILTRVENIGAFLSAGSSLPFLMRFVLLTMIPVIFLIYGLYLIISKPHMGKMLVTGWCFVIGGGIGNLYDRIIHGSVTDFLHLDLVIFQTGIFNLADVSIMTGMIIILAAQFQNRKNGRLAY